ncbi:SH3 domain-containing protein [Fulvivirga lutimaris]|uniref:SH3 domain-containing protein n=1 Tax=Fulvivirga lutimaris TaxID=1819566 RepID=UPI0012BC4A8C|nr:SH3 domain-containing protein [Fulvivirga lutimaris]MTI41816.1 SH3 domain-containing protein [Fulvivirga lutimaris]
MKIMKSYSILCFVVLYTPLLFSQDIINYQKGDIEYLNFKDKPPCFVCTYNIEDEGNVLEYGLHKQITIDTVADKIHEGRYLFGMGNSFVFEFRNDTSYLFVLGIMEYASQVKVLDKIKVPFKNGESQNINYLSCDLSDNNDISIFAITVENQKTYWQKHPLQTFQYFNNTIQAWRVNRETMRFKEIHDLNSVKCLNGSYMDYSPYETTSEELIKGIVGKINDPDGYVNVRMRPIIKSNIVYKLLPNSDFRYWKDPNYNWWKVIIYKNGTPYPIHGFVHKSRLTKK